MIISKQILRDNKVGNSGIYNFSKINGKNIIWHEESGKFCLEALLGEVLLFSDKDIKKWKSRKSR